MARSLIRSVGGYLPKRIITNKELEETVDTSDEWIVQRTGIKQRHIVADDEKTSDMAIAAAKVALDNANLTADDIDAVIVATTTPDRIFPSTAVYVQAELGMPKHSFAFDVQAVCSGFLYGFNIADNFIRAGQCKRVLVIGAESMSRIVDWNDRTTCVLFGDGAGAVILEATDGDNFVLSTSLFSDGNGADLLHVPGGVCMSDKTGTIEMNGREIFKHAVHNLAHAVDEVLDSNHLKKEDINWLVPHQANQRIIEATAKKLGMDMDNVIMTIDQHANTSAASVPLALYEGYKANRFKKGELLLLEAMGAGLTWGGSLVRWAI